MTEVTSKTDQEMLINHIEDPLYLHYYLSSSWNSAVIAVMRWKCTSKPGRTCELIFKSYTSIWIRTYGVPASRSTNKDFWVEHRLLHVCTEMNQKLDVWPYSFWVSAWNLQDKEPTKAKLTVTWISWKWCQP